MYLCIDFFACIVISYWLYRTGKCYIYYTLKINIYIYIYTYIYMYIKYIYIYVYIYIWLSVSQSVTFLENWMRLPCYLSTNQKETNHNCTTVITLPILHAWTLKNQMLIIFEVTLNTDSKNEQNGSNTPFNPDLSTDSRLVGSHTMQDIYIYIYVYVYMYIYIYIYIHIYTYTYTCIYTSHKPNTHTYIYIYYI